MYKKKKLNKKVIGTITAIVILILITVSIMFNRKIGLVENAAKTAKKAYKDNISLKEACVELGFLTAERFDEVFHPEQMI